ncbi:hypothetical protein WG66_009365, partial [Moniliophthora roreri]
MSWGTVRQISVSMGALTPTYTHTALRYLLATVCYHVDSPSQRSKTIAMGMGYGNGVTWTRTIPSVEL